MRENRFMFSVLVSGASEYEEVTILGSNMTRKEAFKKLIDEIEDITKITLLEEGIFK